jgi:hypothetical protein
MPNPSIPAAGEALPARLSSMFSDPFLRRAFRRAERDGGAAFPVPAAPNKPKLTDGAVAPRQPILEGANA